MTIQNIDAAPHGPAWISKASLVVAAALVVTLSICAVVLGLFIRHHIDTAVAEGVEARARTIATDVIKANPDLVADALNRFVKSQQEEAARKEEEGHRANWAEMSRVDAGVPVLGDENAKVTVVYFYDSACPYCKQMDPVLRPLTVSGTGVKIVYREIPILGDASKRAARFGAALWQLSPSDYDSFHGALLGFRGQLTENAIDRIANETLGPDLAMRVATAAVTDPDGKITAKIQRELDLAKKVGVHGTPFFAIGGETFFDGATSRDKFMAAVEKAKGAR
jgi:protein-disulfide isomerase